MLPLICYVVQQQLVARDEGNQRHFKYQPRPSAVFIFPFLSLSSPTPVVSYPVSYPPRADFFFIDPFFFVRAGRIFPALLLYSNFTPSTSQCSPLAWQSPLWRFLQLSTLPHFRSQRPMMYVAVYLDLEDLDAQLMGSLACSGAAWPDAV